ncbi:hypothetical protein [Burkholderia cepacia]|uniref:hypothetical protein n=1 Tax=Burkholderia cepacia TaxID=292 RepID=UPI001651982D|nr:hypothetical protein [Burkholderia cepacia]
MDGRDSRRLKKRGDRKRGPFFLERRFRCDVRDREALLLALDNIARVIPMKRGLDLGRGRMLTFNLVRVVRTHCAQPGNERTSQRGTPHGEQSLRRIDDLCGLVKQRIENTVLGKQRIEGSNGRHASPSGLMQG